MDIVSKTLTEGVDLKVTLTQGKLIATLSIDGEIELDKIAKAIPGELDNLIINVLKVALKTL